MPTVKRTHRSERRTSARHSGNGQPFRLDLAITHLTFEGIQTYGGGVATVTRGHLAALPGLQEELAKHSIRITPYFAEIAYAAEHERRDPEYQRQATEAILAMGGRLEFLVNFTQGYLPRAPWGVGDLGSMENWKVASGSGAAAALSLGRAHQRSLVYCHDSLFALAPVYITLQAPAYGVDVVALYVIHSTALLHEMPLPNPERLMVESLGVQWAKVYPNERLGYISRFMADHIIREYGGHPDTLAPAGNGINPENPWFRLRSREEISDKLRQYRVPLDKPLVFSWGRPVEYKRYDVVIEAAAQLRGQIHPVIMLSGDYPKLPELARGLGMDVTLINAFDPEFVAAMVQWENTQAAASLALNEPGGLTPMEVRMLARKSGALMVVSNTGGLAEQVSDGQDGFVTKQDDAKDVARVLRHILTMDERAKRRIRENGLETVLNRYTWSSQILTTLAATVPEVGLVADEVRAGLVRKTLAAVRA
ncbi:MAG: glycosyltransferase family 4 protein [Chloroflexota bacterium]